MAVDLNRTKAIIELLRQTTSLGVVSDFLKSKGRHHSAGTWEDMESKRLIPAVTDRAISNDDLIKLLRSAEESGRQHVFLYSCEGVHAAALMDEARILATLRKKGLAELWEKPRILDQPEVPTIVDVRLDGVGKGRKLTIKEIELRTQHRLERTERDGDVFRKIYKVRSERVVNLLRLHATGLLEIRIGSHANSSKYEQDILRFWRQTADFVPADEFLEVSLSKAKHIVLTNRENLRDLIRYGDTTLRNENGVVLRAATGNDAGDLCNDKGAQGSIDVFMAEEGECEGLNFFFRPAPGLPKEIHVLLSGAVNEFALPANCTEEDHGYVLDQLRFLNK